jgi:hypothetical protein
MGCLLGQELSLLFIAERIVESEYTVEAVISDLLQHHALIRHPTTAK